MNKAPFSPLNQALLRILRPLARLLLRNGIPYGEFTELVKRAYVEAAFEDFSDGRRKTTDSKAAVLTGLTRKEVKRQREILAGQTLSSKPSANTNRASRVVSGWVHDARYHGNDGQPARLPFEGERSFTSLVRQYSGDMPPRSVLDELIRVGVVYSDEADGYLILKKRAYVPAGDSDEMLAIFGEDVADLIRTIDHNLTGLKHDHQPLFQRTLTYNNIPVSVIEQWRALAADRSQQLLERLDDWLGPHDQDVSGTGDRTPAVRTGVSIFYFEESPAGQAGSSAPETTDRSEP